MPKSTSILEVRWCIHNYNQVIGYKTCNHKVPYKPTSLDRSNTKKKKCWVFILYVRMFPPIYTLGFNNLILYLLPSITILLFLFLRILACETLNNFLEIIVSIHMLLTRVSLSKTGWGNCLLTFSSHMRFLNTSAWSMHLIRNSCH